MEEKTLQRIVEELMRSNELAEQQNALLEQYNVLLEAVIELGIGFVNVRARSIANPFSEAEGKTDATRAAQSAREILRRTKSIGKSQAKETFNRLENM